ncbi:hypothetical protein BLA24_15360 [Streptomyces cinnamoneus]|uniref:Sortase n=1 Tax=Streptomyces cinnamoneus TaxID=53446 RepID=A0A2G1XIS0_STRCJ|nr:hypothetical protein [Streptomyces cinnamoneus]PHQ51144.1 hypothetical protein BLA24_15360 [Streptomyces cinnamoneus]PPT13633.1 hypothetical protein CYQ11_12715 [Streptomyces cinnamoneus]
MRNARVLAGAAMTITALGLCGAPALAADEFGKLEISPARVQPGETVTVNTTACGAKGHGTADASAVGGPASFELKPGTRKEVAAGEFRVPDSAKPGTYGIGAKCDNGKEATGDVTVGKGSGSGPSPAAGTGSRPAPRPASPSATRSMPAAPPQGGMKTGVGGTSEDSGTTEIVAGATVLGAAVAAGAWFLRRRGGDNRV